MRNLVVISFVLSFCLPGCSYDPVKNIDPGKPIQLTPGSGMIVGSVTAPRDHHWWEVMRFDYRKLDHSESGILLSASPTSNFMWMKDIPIQPGGIGPDMGLEHQLGRLFAIELPAGEYEIYILSHNTNPTVATNTPIKPLRFEVRAGEIHYIGSLNVRLCLSSTGHRTYVSGGIPSVRNESGTDLRLLKQKYPALETRNILNTVMDDQAWRGIECVKK